MKKTLDVTLLTRIIDQYVSLHLFGNSVLCDFRTDDELYDNLMKSMWLGIDINTVREWYDLTLVKGLRYDGDGNFRTWLGTYTVADFDDIKVAVENIVDDIVKIAEEA